MSEAMNFKVGPTLAAPTAAIKQVDPNLLTDCSECEGNVYVSSFPCRRGGSET